MLSPLGAAGIAKRSRSPAWLWAGIALLVLVVFAIPGMATRSLWSDEIASVLFAGLPLDEFYQLVFGREVNMVLYYFVLRYWLAFGDSEFSMRLLSLIFAGCAVLILFVLTKRTWGDRVASTSVILLATNSTFVAYAVEARGYSLLVLTTCLSYWTLFVLLEVPGWRRALAYAGAVATTIYSHFFGLLVPFAHWIGILCAGITRSRKLLTVIFPAFFLILIAATPLILAVLHYGGVLTWMEKPTVRSVYYMAIALVGNGGEPLLLAYLGICGVGCYQVFRRYPGVADGYRVANLVVLSGCTVPIFVAFLVSQISPAFTVRYLLVVLPPMVILAAVGIEAIRSSKLRAVILGTVVFISMAATYIGRENETTQDWRASATYLQNNVASSDAILFFSPWMKNNIKFYTKRLNGSDPPGDIVYPKAEGYPLISNLGIDPLPSEIVASLRKRYQTVWLVLAHDWSKSMKPISDRLRSELRLAFPTEDERIFEGNIRVVRYQ